MCFEHTTLPEIKNSPPKEKFSIEMQVGDFKQYYNNKIDKRGIISDKDMGYNCLVGIVEPWKNSKLISSYEKETDKKAHQAYTLNVDGKITQIASPTLNIFSVITLFIIPSYNTTTFDLKMKLKDNATGKIFNATLYSSFTIWKELIFLPLFPLFLSDMDEGRLSKSMHLYHEFKKQGAFN